MRLSRGEVHVEPPMPLEPLPNLGVLVGGVVVGNQMHVEVLRRLGIDPTQELEPLLMPVSGNALADHLPVATSRAANRVVMPPAFALGDSHILFRYHF
jgi:hypothetical protein